MEKGVPKVRIPLKALHQYGADVASCVKLMPNKPTQRRRSLIQGPLKAIHPKSRTQDTPSKSSEIFSLFSYEPISSEDESEVNRQRTLNKKNSGCDKESLISGTHFQKSIKPAPPTRPRSRSNSYHRNRASKPRPPLPLVTTVSKESVKSKDFGKCRQDRDLHDDFQGPEPNHICPIRLTSNDKIAEPRCSNSIRHALRVPSTKDLTSKSKHTDMMYPREDVDGSAASDHKLTVRRPKFEKSPTSDVPISEPGFSCLRNNSSSFTRRGQEIWAKTNKSVTFSNNFEEHTHCDCNTQILEIKHDDHQSYDEMAHSYEVEKVQLEEFGDQEDPCCTKLAPESPLDTHRGDRPGVSKYMSFNEELEQTADSPIPSFDQGSSTGPTMLISSINGSTKGAGLNLPRSPYGSLSIARNDRHYDFSLVPASETKSGLSNGTNISPSPKCGDYKGNKEAKNGCSDGGLWESNTLNIERPACGHRHDVSANLGKQDTASGLSHKVHGESKPSNVYRSSISAQRFDDSSKSEKTKKSGKRSKKGTKPSYTLDAIKPTHNSRSVFLVAQGTKGGPSLRDNCIGSSNNQPNTQTTLGNRPYHSRHIPAKESMSIDNIHDGIHGIVPIGRTEPIHRTDYHKEMAGYTERRAFREPSQGINVETQRGSTRPMYMYHRDDHETLAECTYRGPPMYQRNYPQTVSGYTQTVSGYTQTVSGYTKTYSAPIRERPKRMLGPNPRAATGPINQNDNPEQKSGHVARGHSSGTSTSSLPPPRPKPDTLVPCLFKRKAGQALPPVLGKAAPPTIHQRPPQCNVTSWQQRGFRY